MDTRTFFRSFAAASLGISGVVAKECTATVPVPSSARPGTAAVGVDEAMRVILDGRAPRTVGTGFLDLDRITDGLPRGSVVAIAGRPSLGKSALAFNFAERIALHQRMPVAIFSAPHTAFSTFARFVSSIAKVDQHLLRGRNRMTKVELSRVTRAGGVLREAPLLVDDRVFLTPAEVRIRAQALARDCDQRLGAIVVDQPELLDFADPTMRGMSPIAQTMNGLKVMAAELDVPIIVTTRVGLRVDYRWNKRPQLTDLRPAMRPIGRGADLVLLVYRDEVYDPETTDKGIAEIMVERNRFGPTGGVRLSFRGEWGRFEDLPPWGASNV